MAQCLGEFVEASFPEASIVGDPRVELTERFRTKRIETLLPFWTNLDETRLVQYAEMPRNSRLVNIEFSYETIYRVLASLKRLDDAQTHGVSQSLKNAYMHIRVYTLLNIYLSRGSKNYETAVVALAGTKWKLLKEAARRIKRTVGYEEAYDFLRGFSGLQSMVEYADGSARKNPLMLH